MASIQMALPLADEPAVQFVRHRRARRYILRVLHDGTVRVTLPRGGSAREARELVDKSTSWISRQRDERRRAAAVDRRWRHGTAILVDGLLTRLTVEVSQATVRVRAGDAVIAESPGLDGCDVRPAAQAWLRARATRELPPALLALATAHGIDVRRVSVRDQQSRWGACTRRGTITLNWRLVQVPPFVREYVMLHELMHVRELNHSRRFWKLVIAVCPRHAEARRWLLSEGRALF